MRYIIPAILFVVGVVLAIEIRRYLKNRHVPRWVQAETKEIGDDVLGQCKIELPVVGQNQSKGFVKCTHTINGESVEFTNDFIDETGGTDGLDDALAELRQYFLLASDSENLKIFKNALGSQVEMHNTLFPQSKISESELKTTAKLRSVVPMGENKAWFRFSSKKFMQGRPVFVTVSNTGTVESVGVG